MAGELVSQPWSPPESKGMQAVVKYGAIAGIVMAGIYAYTLFAPTLIDAVRLTDYLLQDLKHMAVSLAVTVVTLWLVRETISPAGGINRLLRLPYWMIVNGLTKFFITIDPLSPINERITAVQADKELFEKNFETFDGLISNLKLKEEKYLDMSLQAQKLGRQAQAQGKTAAVEIQAHNFGSYRDAAATYAKTRGQLEPYRDTFQKISSACDVTVQKLTNERDVLADKWQTQKAVNAATTAASRILGRSKTQVWNLAQQAESIIDTKYGEELGHLDHLKRFATPFLESIDVENGTYNEEMLQQVQSTSVKLLTASAATDSSPAPGSAVLPSDPIPKFV